MLTRLFRCLTLFALVFTGVSPVSSVTAVPAMPAATAAAAPPPLANVAKISAGINHACAQTVTGEVLCWGRGYGPIPARVSGLAAAALEISAGYAHTCALLAGGTVQCWGSNLHGQLGDGTTQSSDVPVTVTGLAGPAAAVMAGSFHTCALLVDETVQCWGRNFYGQLGSGTTSAAGIPTPVKVTGLAGPVLELTSLLNHTCALIRGGAVQCWGYNGAGQLGDASTTNSAAPRSVSGLAGPALRIAAGYDHTCVLLAAGQLPCWGANWSGQLGDGSTTSRLSPGWTVPHSISAPAAITPAQWMRTATCAAGAATPSASWAVTALQPACPPPGLFMVCSIRPPAWTPA